MVHGCQQLKIRGDILDVIILIQGNQLHGIILIISQLAKQELVHIVQLYYM